MAIKEIRFYASLGMMAAGIGWWFFTGYETILESETFRNYALIVRPYGMISAHGFIFLVASMCAVFYPVILWISLSFCIADTSAVKDLMPRKGDYGLWLAPIMIVPLISLMVVIYGIASFVINIFLLLYLVAIPATCFLRKK